MSGQCPATITDRPGVIAHCTKPVGHDSIHDGGGVVPVTGEESAVARAPFFVSAGAERALTEAARTGRDINIAGALYRKVNHGASAEGLLTDPGASEGAADGLSEDTPITLVAEVLRSRMDKGTSGRWIADHSETPETLARAIADAARQRPQQAAGDRVSAAVEALQAVLRELDGFGCREDNDSCPKWPLTAVNRAADTLDIPRPALAAASEPTEAHP